MKKQESHSHKHNNHEVKKNKKFSLKQIGVLIIVLLISLSLVPWVISNDLFSNSVNDDQWVKVGNKYTISNIILGEYSSYVEKNYYYVQQNPYLLMQALNGIISQYVNILLFANEAENINLSVDKNLLLTLISEIPAFQNEDGTFNTDEFRARVNVIFGSEENFLANITDNILKDQLLEPIFPLIQEPFFVSYIDLLALSQKRTVKYIDVTSSINKDTLPVASNDDLIKIRDENKSLFTTLESRNGEYISIDTNKLMEKVTVTDEEVLKYYNKTKESYVSPELRTISQISFETKEEAEKAFKDLKEGKPLDKTFSDIENIDFASLPKDFAQPVFSAKVNELNKPAQSPIGWHIFKVTKITPQGVKPLSEVKVSVKEELLNNKRNSLLEEKKTEIISLVDEGNSLKDVATKTGAVYHKFTNLGEDNIVVKKIPEEVYKQVSTLQESNNSGLVEDQDANLYIVHLDKITPSFLKEIKDAKNDLVAIWKQQELEEKSHELEAKIVSDLIAGKKISTLGYKVNVFNGVMVENGTLFSPETLETVFTSEKNTPLTGTLQNKNTIVAVVENIKNKDIYYEKNNIRNQEVVDFAAYASNDYIQSYFDRYASVISKKYKIKINQKAILNKLAPNNPNE